MRTGSSVTDCAAPRPCHIYKEVCGMTVIDKFRLNGKKILVTGGNRGLGQAFVQALAEAGATVVFCGRNESVNAEAVKQLANAGVEASAIAGDVTSEADRIVNDAVQVLGGLDVLVNNAGIAIHRASLEQPDEEFEQTFDLNVTALWKMSLAAARVFNEQGRGGVIVNISSISSWIVNRPQMQAAYNASKAAVNQLTTSLAAEWAPQGIRINAVAPGYTKTEMAPVDKPEFKRHWIDDAPMQRYAMPDEIAPAVVFLASEASSFCTGTILKVDGGYTIY